MIFESLASIENTVSAALLVAAFSFAFGLAARERLKIAATLTAWFAIVVALGATLALDGRVGVGVAGLGIATALPTMAICFAFFKVPSVRAALFATPLPVLVGLNALRVLGILFLVLYAQHRLPAPFAPSAGYGDIFVGLTALPVAWLLMRHGSRAKAPALVWNVIGLVDLIVAVSLGATSSPGPIRLFSSSSDTSLMVTLPWILVPCFLVPCWMALHVAIVYRLLREEPNSIERSTSAHVART